MPMRLYGVTFILAGIIMFIITLVQLLKFLSFRNCEITTARVLAVDSAKHFSNNRSRTTYSMKLSYVVDGIAYERNLACDSEEYKLGANREVEIRYKSRNPKKILLNAGEKQARGQKILWLITLAIFAIGAVLLFIK